MACAPIGELGACRPINMDLPGHGREGCKVVLTTNGHPRQSISAVDITSHSFAERTTPIVQGDLRDSAEKIFAHHFELGDHRDQHGCDAGAHDVGHTAFGGNEAKHAIGGSDQSSSKADSLSFVTVEE